MNRANITFNYNTVDGVNFMILQPTELIQSFHACGHWYEENMIKFIQKNYGGGSFVGGTKK